MKSSHNQIAPYPSHINQRRKYRAPHDSKTQLVEPPPKPLLVRLFVFDLATGEAIRQHDFNYMDQEAKRQINKINLWALNNHKSVELMNVADDNSVDN